MNFLLYLISFLLIACWIVGYFVLNAGILVYFFLVLAAIPILFRALRGNEHDHFFHFGHKKH
jgi:hypothetical protein